MRFFLALLRLLAGSLIVVTAVPAALALLGGIVPELDLLNHLQLVLFCGTLVGLILAALLRMRRWAIVVASLGLLTSAWTFGPEWLSSLQQRPAPTGAHELRLMTHNMFGLNYDMQRMAKSIFSEDPDIVALQEYFPEQTPLDALLKSRYPYSVRCEGGKRANLGLYSKIPFDREMGAADCPADAFGAQRTAHIIAGFTLADGSHFSVMTTHMDWPLPIARQHDEFAAAEAAANAVDGPLLVVGDFNSTPWSQAMKTFEAATDLHRETRNLITFPELFTVPGGLIPVLPFLPLDQVFQRGISVTALHAGAPTGSDHLPVIFSFEVKR